MGEENAKLNLVPGKSYRELTTMTMTIGEKKRKENKDAPGHTA
jgi:hypothetical protein